MPFEELKQNYNEAVQQLIAERDELKLQVHLFNMEAKYQWYLAEEKWAHVRQKARQVGFETATSSDRVKHSLEEVLIEIRESYQRLKKLF